MKVPYAIRVGGRSLPWLVIAVAALGWSARSAGTTPAREASLPPFPSGIYYGQPASDTLPALLRLLGGDLPFDLDVSEGFDLRGDTAVGIDVDNTVVIVKSDGGMRRLEIRGLHSLARPSLSPDRTRIAVQATTRQSQGLPRFLTIYVIDLANGDWRELVPPTNDAIVGNEMPKWFPKGERVGYWAVEDQCLVIRVVDVADGTDRLTIRDRGTSGCFQPDDNSPGGPRFQFAVSENGKKLLIAGQLQIYKTKNGKLIADIRDKVLRQLGRAGFGLDERFPGAAGGGTFPLHAAFSPNGKLAVLAGAVSKDNAFGELLFRIRINGKRFKPLLGPVAELPELSNNLNFSQLTPVWR